VRHLEVVLKTAERCNINCSYCYFFNKEDKSYKEHPPFLSENKVTKISNFLANGCEELSLQGISIIFHGGEPLLQKKSQFDAMCTQFRKTLEPHVDLTFSVQTNAMLVDQEWIELFSKHKVGVGVSLDGPKDYNDLFRQDHLKRGTYDRVKKGITQLNIAVKHNLISTIGLISVINPNFDAKRIYRHFVDDLHCTRLNFLLPDYTHDSFHADSVLNYGKYLCDLFHEWIKDDNPIIQIRFINSIINKFMSDPTLNPSSLENTLIVISSNGNIVPDDTLRITKFWNNDEEINIENVSLKEYLETSIFKIINQAKRQLPATCQSCCWKNICEGGSAIHRYSKEKKFNNASLFCDALQDFIALLLITYCLMVFPLKYF